MAWGNGVAFVTCHRVLLGLLWSIGLKSTHRWRPAGPQGEGSGSTRANVQSGLLDVWKRSSGGEQGKCRPHPQCHGGHAAP